MSVVVCPIVPFPNIYWWSHWTDPETVIEIDEHEHFEKMSLRNRYLVAGADGVITLSIPLSDGRQQRKAMKDVGICNDTRWQVQHWRTLVSVYNRSPYFEHYAPLLAPLFETPFERLSDFSMAGIRLLQQICGFSNEWRLLPGYEARYEGAKDIRRQFRSSSYTQVPASFLPYQQTFGDRHGFLPNLSILDLLFAEGPGVHRVLQAR